MPRKIADLAMISESEWLNLRTQGIGSSDAAAILGVSPWRTPLQVYAEKLGLVEPVSETPAMRWGKLLEPLVADEYARETGRLVEHPHALYQHDRHDFMLATPDRFASTERGQLVVEIKTTNVFRADEWEEEPPLVYQVQLQHLLAVLDLSVGSLVCLIGGSRLVWLDVERNDRFIALLVERSEEFWRRVETLSPPAPGRDDRETLARLYPKDTGALVTLPAEASEWDRRLIEAKEQIKTWEAVKDEAEALLKGAIGEATFGVLPGGARYSWKSSPRDGYVVEPTTVRTLRRLKS